MLGILHHLLKTFQRADFIGIVRIFGNAVSIGSHVREIDCQAFLVQINLGILAVDKFDFAHLFLF